MRDKLAGYYRLSMEDDNIKEESNSIINQRLLIERYISEHKEFSDYEYCEFYDDGYSGTTMKRPGIQALLELVKQNEIYCIIVKDLSRFSRDYIEMGTYLEQIFPFMRIRFISISDHYDSNDYIGKTADIDVAFKSLLADFYCKDVSKKVKSSLTAKRKQGKYATGNTPFGYCKKPGNINTLQIVPEEAKVIRYIFGLSLSGMSLTQICKTLNDEKILTPLEFKNLRKKQNRKELQQKRKFWQQGTVRAILINESYIGSMVYNKTFQKEVGGGKTILKPREEWNVFKNHHEPIIDEEVFEKVQKLYPLKDSVTRTQIEYVLKGKVFCSYCKRTLRAMKLSGDKLFYYCANKSLSSDNGCMTGNIGNDLIEQIILEQIKVQMKQLIDLEEIKESSIIQWQERFQQKGKEVASVEREMENLMERKAKLLEGYHAGGFTKEEYLERYHQLEQQVSQKWIEKEGMNRQLDRYKRLIGKNGYSYDRFFQYAGFNVLTKKMSDVFLDKIEIDHDKVIHIYWKFSKQGREEDNDVTIVYQQT